MNVTISNRVLITIAAAVVAIALLIIGFVCGSAQMAAAAETAACEQAEGAACDACDEPESCCAGAEDVLKELGRV